MIRRLNRKDLDVMSGIADSIARSFARKAKVRDAERRALRDDLRQEAFLAMLDATRSWRAGSAPWAAYLRQSAVNRVRLAAWQASSPLAVKDKANVASIALSHQRVGVEVLAGAAAAEDVERDAGARLLRERVSLRVARLLAEDRDAEAVLEVLSGRAAPAEAAKDAGVEVRRLYAAAKRAKRKLRDDPELLTLWLESRED